MRSIKTFLGVLFVVTIMVAVVPAAHASSSSYNVPCLNTINSPNCHVHMIGAGSSAQFLTSAIAADQFAHANEGSGQCSFHWTGKNSGELFDARASEFEPGNVWVVWIASQDGSSCATSIGNTNITDIWLDIQVDSTVGVRSFFASQASGQVGDSVYVIPAAASNLVTPSTLWPDGRGDVQITSGGATNIPLALGTDATGVKDVYVNVGLTDIRPEDAIVATDRAMDKLNATFTGLGYGPENIGTPYLTSQGTGTRALPLAFTLSGNDPITNAAVRPYTTVALGAGEIIFMYNNNNASPNPVKNLVTGVGGTGTGRFKAAYLFGGGLLSTHCTTDSSAFGGANDGSGVPLKLYLREPLSGTMNTTEFNVFRTTGNTGADGSQEAGVGAPPTNNPLNGLPCANDAGARFRVIGTGESRDAVLNNANGLGYQFFAFANMAKYAGSTKYNYLTVDGVDPLGGNLANAAQTPPNCGGPCTAIAEWGGPSFPNLRNGTYKVWSIYRWVVEDSNDYGDSFGPAHVAQNAQDVVDSTVADFVPFCSTVAADSLDVYRSHFNIVHDLWVPAVTGVDGPVSACGNSLGSGTEAGGDVGGLIEGPFPASGKVTVSATTLKATWKSGQKFNTWASTTSAVGNTITIGSATCTITGTVTATSAPINYSASGPCNPPTGTTQSTYTYNVQTNGVLTKKE